MLTSWPLPRLVYRYPAPLCKLLQLIWSWDWWWNLPLAPLHQMRCNDLNNNIGYLHNNQSNHPNRHTQLLSMTSAGNGNSEIHLCALFVENYFSLQEPLLVNTCTCITKGTTIVMTQCLITMPSWKSRQVFFFSSKLQTHYCTYKSCHDANFVGTADTEHCHNDNPLYHQ